MSRVVYVSIGSILFVLFILQDVVDLRWQYLWDLQQEQMYRRWSGLFLSVLILFQWSLSLVRTVPKWQNKSLTYYSIHTWMGAFTPLFFYVHSMNLGFAYLLILSLTFFGNFLLGMVNTDVIKSQKQWYFQGWMITHVAFSLFISLLTVYHVWVVFYYQ